ncbi:alpha-L-arabinofuranosidase C-terminal domain-containing protein [uncultured Bacteroides sp.]|uniref:alpha-L-arabinofuranosidase C-terminal domain-containing protein n=1 Tax=uncultured Bacteroides sp. TaxID=162156 RepID=UPI00262DE25D|nr:alpha-L-arabinofuranosidase C-terminal domain-containing protein [uncultured Bacteroides sp.]
MKQPKTKKRFGMSLLGLGLAVSASALTAVPDSVYLFSYNAHPGSGLNMAWSADQKYWSPIGLEHAFIKSDFGVWGGEKKMYNPYLIRTKDGVWRCVFQVNDYSNQFAVAESRDLVLWQPQDYPYMEGVSSCLEPVLKYDSNRNMYQVLFKTKEGDYYMTESSDFYNFTKPVKVGPDYLSSASKDVIVDGRKMRGQVTKVAYRDINTVVTAMEAARYRESLNAELASGNEELFKDLKPLEAQISINLGDTKKISDKLIGIFFEDISYAADGGLYAELVQNRDFEYSLADTKGSKKNWNSRYAWKADGNGGTWNVEDKEPIHKNNPHYALLDVKKSGEFSLQNEGFDGIPVRKGEKYIFSMFARQIEGNSCKFDVTLEQDGRVVASTKVSSSNKEWKKLKVTFKANADADKAVIRITPRSEGKVAIDMISLFPKNTFKGRENGMRADLAQVLADLKPKFMRFPGGCVAHGDGLHNIYNWKETIGPLESRKPQRNIWNYHQTKGLGYYEYFQFCEDIGCEPLPVLAAGVSCQNSSDCGAGQQGGIPMDKMPEYIQDVLDLIEWANGDARTTEWGKRRAEQGHPAPFNLKYIGIGNEDLISKTFTERYLMIIKAVKEKYPDIIVCGTSGPWCEGSDYEAGWRLAKDNNIDMIDEHYYQTPGWFIYHQNYYDQYDRNGSKVYLGEYAAHAPGRPNNIETALCEAMHICNMERNGDIVEMSSYAPLLAKEGHINWSPDMIYFNNNEVKLTVGYHVQKLCGNYCGDEYIGSSLSVNESRKGVRERLAVSTVRDSKTGKVYIKMVNLLNHPVKGKLKIDNAESIFGKEVSLNARLHLLTGNYDDTKAVPQIKDIVVTPEFEYELPAYSFSLIEL